MIYHLQRYERRYLLHTKVRGVVKESVEAGSWLEAKHALGFYMSSLSLEMMMLQIRRREEAKAKALEEKRRRAEQKLATLSL